MKKAQRDKDALAIDRPEEFLRRERIAQTVGVVLMTLFVAAGLAGLFGSGPLAHAAVNSGNVTIRFERFTRQTFNTALDISVEGATGPTVSVSLPRAFLDKVDMLEVRPSDALKRMDADTATFEIPAGNGSATLVLQYEPKEYGVLDFNIVAGTEPPARVRQLVFF